MAQNLGALTDTWMTNPYMFEPSQLSNPYSNYGGSALPWPPTYNTGLAGGPVNAATGQPIQSFQQWQAQNPAGLSINSTPAQPQAPAPAATPNAPGTLFYGMNPGGTGPGPAFGGLAAALQPQAGQQAAPQAAPPPQPSGPPNNWQAAINSLANPGNPVTQGANVPMITGSQPAGGVNNAFLQQAGAGQGMNQNFLSALRAIQARPQS
jgi:hypothetical protein